MRVYLSCHHPAPANELAATLTAAGHEIASTWHASPDLRPAGGDAEGWANAADRNCQEIEECGAFVLIASPEHLDGTKRVPGGKFFEMGYATRVETEDGDRPVRCFTLGGVENGMLYTSGITHVATAAELLDALKK